MLAPFLAWRYLRRRRAAWLSIAAVTLTVTVPVVILGIMQGWVRVTEQQVRGAEADLTVRSPYRYQGLAAERWDLADILHRQHGVRAVAPFVYGEALVQNPIASRKSIFAVVDGIDLGAEQQLQRMTPEALHHRPALDLSAPELAPEERGTGFVTQQARSDLALLAGQALVAGPIAGPWQPKLKPGLMVGRELAYTHGGLLEPGQRVTISVPDGSTSAVRKARLTISDTVSTGVYETDRTMMWLSIPTAQQLTAFDARRNNGEGLVSGFRVGLDNPEDWQQARDAIESNTGLIAEHWSEIRFSLLKNTQIYRNLMLVVMILIQCLCIFISYAVFSTLVAEKRHDIGVLLGMGARPASMARAFLLAGLIASSMGGLLGWLLGWGVLAIINPISNYGGFQIFPQEFIYTAETPISFDPSLPILFVAISAITGLIAAALPAWRAASTPPIASIREAG